MGVEVTEKTETIKSKEVNIRLMLPKSLHKRVKKHQYVLNGKPTIADAAIDLIKKGLETKVNSL